MGRIYDFIANTTDGVFAVDSKQWIVLWNGPATSILGYTADEVLGQPCYRILRGRGPDGCTCCVSRCETFRAALGLKKVATTDVIAQAKNGTDVWLSVTTLLVPSPGGALSRLVHLFRDVTRERGLEHVVGEVAEVLRTHLADAVEHTANTSGEATSPADVTRRELQVLRCLAAGLSTEAIAETLFISPHTVRRHVESLLKKLGAHSRLEAVAISRRYDLR